MNATNTVALPYLNQIIEVSERLWGLPALPLVFIACIAFGYFLSSIPIYRRKYIPAGVFLFGCGMNLLITPLASFQVGVRAAILGFIAGGMAWLAHRKIMSKWIAESEFRSSGTEEICKAEATQPITPNPNE